MRSPQSYLLLTPDQEAASWSDFYIWHVAKTSLKEPLVDSWWPKLIVSAAEALPEDGGNQHCKPICAPPRKEIAASLSCRQSIRTCCVLAHDTPNASKPYRSWKAMSQRSGNRGDLLFDWCEPTLFSIYVGLDISHYSLQGATWPLYPVNGQQDGDANSQVEPIRWDSRTGCKWASSSNQYTWSLPHHWGQSRVETTHCFFGIICVGRGWHAREWRQSSKFSGG